MLRDITQRKNAEARIRESERFTRDVLDNLFVYVGVITPDGTLIETNRAPLDAAGLSSEQVLGQKFWDCYWWSYSPHVQLQLKESIECAARGEVVRYDVQVRVKADALIWIDFQLAPLRDGNGQITHLIPSGTDLTERKLAETERQRLASIIHETPDFIGVATLDGKVVYINPGGRALVGIADDEDVAGHDIGEWHPPEVGAELLSTAIPIAVREGAWRGQTELVRRNGQRVPVSQIILAHRSESGRVETLSTIMRDMTEQRRAFEHQNLLLRELSHRVKNTLAVVQSIARQSLRNDPDPREFARVFQGRIASLAASHSLLTNAEWRGASLVEIIRSQLEPVLTGNGSRLVLDGPDILLPPETATQLGLVVHELGTNAVKHGAFSTPQGKLRIGWSRTDDALDISWEETGGPQVAAGPVRRGFGSVLIEKLSGGEVRRTHDRDGFRMAFSVKIPDIRSSNSRSEPLL
jgi:PAS domain S-box-containing protein